MIAMIINTCTLNSRKRKAYTFGRVHSKERVCTSRRHMNINNNNDDGDDDDGGDDDDDDDDDDDVDDNDD